MINLIAKYSIEERIEAGINFKGELFDGVLDGGEDEVILDRQKRRELVSQLREMMWEDAEMLRSESIAVEELAEDTPHFLNPEVLKTEVDFIGEEDVASLDEP